VKERKDESEVMNLTTFECDVLIVGGGAAAARAAIEAADNGAFVILVDKGIFGFSGASGIHAGWVVASSFLRLNGDNMNAHFMDTLRGGGWIANQKLVRIMCNEACARILELETYGNMFTRGFDGKPKAFALGGHSRKRSFTPAYMWIMANEVRRRGVRILEEVIITNLVNYEGQIVGATGINIKTGEFYVFRAKSTVLATGGAGQLYGFSTVSAITTNPQESTGDGYAMAYRAGCELVDMEFQQFLLGLLYPPVLMGSFPAIYPAMKDCVCDKDKNFWMKELPLTKVTRARLINETLNKIEKGKGSPHGGVWADFSGAEDFYKEFPNTLETYCIKHVLPKFRMDYKRQMFEVAPSLHHFMGGVVINEKCETTIPGLYACGEVTGGIHGGNRLGSNAFIDCLVFGKRAGEFAAKRALNKIERPKMDWKQVENEYERIYDILKRTPEKPIKVHEIRRKIQKIIFSKAGPRRVGKDMEDAVRELEKIRVKELPRMYVRSKTTTYNIEWVEGLATYNMIDTAEMILRSSLTRTESREAHQRRDYPETDNENWLMNIYIKKAGDTMNIFTRPIVATEVTPEMIKEMMQNHISHAEG